MGAWIEIDNVNGELTEGTVAPFVGAWIEILSVIILSFYFRSLPLWERGLKSDNADTMKVETLSLPLWERGLK